LPASGLLRREYTTSVPPLAWIPGKIAAIAELIRAVRIVKAAYFVLLGAYLGGSSVRSVASVKVILGVTVVSTAMAFSYVVNDINDIEVDTISKPNRPIPSGRIAIPKAVRLAILLLVYTVGMSIYLGPVIFTFTLSVLLLGFLYSFYFKSTVLIGNIVVAAIVSSIAVFGSLLTNGPTDTTLIIASLSFLLLLQFEVIHTAADSVGDAQAGLTTTSIVLGLPKTARLCQLIASVYVMVSLFPWIDGSASCYYVLSQIFCVMLPLSIIIYFITIYPTVENFHFSEVVFDVIWVTAVIPAILIK
jgi:geranylgeranylglycerol-phosphate geranylgeranyltransferase